LILLVAELVVDAHGHLLASVLDVVHQVPGDLFAGLLVHPREVEGVVARSTQVEPVVVRVDHRVEVVAVGIVSRRVLRRPSPQLRSGPRRLRRVRTRDRIAK